MEAFPVFLSRDQKRTLQMHCSDAGQLLRRAREVEVDFALINSAIDMTTFSASALAGDDAGHWKPGSLAIADSGFWLLAANNTEQHHRGQMGMASLCDGTWLSIPHDKRMVAVLSNWRLVRRVGGETQELCRIGNMTAPSGL
jgi:hypothetical protein